MGVFGYSILQFGDPAPCAHTQHEESAIARVRNVFPSKQAETSRISVLSRGLVPFIIISPFFSV